MSATEHKVRMAMIGCGGMARLHIRNVLRQQDTTQVVVACEPSDAAYEAFCKEFEEAGVQPPPNDPHLMRMLDDYHDKLDAAMIITPHALHHGHAKACLESGIDVLLEKPMVMNEIEALDLIATRDSTGRLLVVSFNGSLSPQIRTASRMLHSGELGEVLTINATVWQNWRPGTLDTWRQNPALSGGGMLFDTGAHMLNTVVDLAGEDFVEVSAWLDNRDTPVDILGAIIARTESGILVTMNACGDSPPDCASDVKVFTTQAIVQTCVWGRSLSIQRTREEGFVPVPVPETLGQWQQFLAVRAGEMPNPCPPEVGLRMARLWDAIQASASVGGRPTCVGQQSHVAATPMQAMAA